MRQWRTCIRRDRMDKGMLALDLELPQDVVEVMKRLGDSGFDVWLVGGAIRDHLLGLGPKDWDVATNASSRRIMELFNRVIPVGLRHGTVSVYTGARAIEVTSYQGAGMDGILGDLGRRDFTMNALAASYPGGEVLDPHRGRRDLAKGLLRAVGDPFARFREDPLRTLRAGRFVSAYGLRIHGPTFDALKGEAGGLSQVASERVRDEMLKLLMGAHVAEAFEWMRRGGVMGAILPELMEGLRKRRDEHHKLDIYRHTLHTIRSSPPRLTVRLAALLHDLGRARVRRQPGGRHPFPDCRRLSAQMAVEVLRRWRVSQRETHDVALLIEHLPPRGAGQWSGPELRRLMSRVGVELIEDLLDLADADHASHTDREEAARETAQLRSRIQGELSGGPPLALDDLAVDGKDVMEVLGLGPGPHVGEMLRRLHAEVIEDPGMNQRKTLINFLKKEYSRGA